MGSPDLGHPQVPIEAKVLPRQQEKGIPFRFRGCKEGFWRSASRVPQGPGAPGQGFPRFPEATSGSGARKVAEGSTSGSMGSGASRLGSARCTAII